jgi:hypothetical protein
MLSRFQALARTLALGGAAVAMLAVPGVVAPAQARADEPIARFEDPLCPGVAGLKAEAAATMVGRMRENAEALGLRMAPDGACRANVIVAFVEDGQAYLARMENLERYAFSELNLQERRLLFDTPGPARAMLRVVPRSRDGMPMAQNENLVDIPQTRSWMAHSKIYSAIRNDIYFALVLIDRDEIDGLNLRQLADYATFRALARELPAPADAGPGSILTLFDGDTPPAEMSEFDRAYLATLYEGLPNMPAAARLADLAQTARSAVAE